MKKFLVALCVLAGVAGANVNAQEFKPKAGSFMLETGFSPFTVNGNNISLQGGEIKAIYLPTEKIGVRLGVGFGNSTSNDDNGLKDDNWMKTTEKMSQFSLTPGVFYAFSGTDHLMPYVGGEFIFATTSNKTTTEKKDYKQEIKNDNEPFNTFGFGLFAGFNYFFSKNIFVGAEIGIAMERNSLKNAVVETTQNGSSETVEPDNDSSSINFGTVFNPSIRLGWAF